MKKIIALIAVLALILGLCACGKSVDASKDEEKVKESGVLKVGMECAYAPFNWTQTDDGNGAVKIANAEGYANGYDVQIAKKVADKLGVKLEIYAYEWDALIPAVQSGNLDCIIAGMSPTEDRKEEIDFSSNYYISNLVIITKKDSAYASAKSLEDFAGAKISAQDGTFHAQALSQIKDVKSSVMKDFTMLYTAVTAGTIDGYVAEEPTALQVCGSNDDLTYVALVNNDTGFTCTEGDTAIAVGIRKGSQLNEKAAAAIDDISVEERAEIMKKMVELAPAEE
jgi:putative lysine transport system substrate-binding protein